MTKETVVEASPDRDEIAGMNHPNLEERIRAILEAEAPTMDELLEAKNLMEQQDRQAQA